MFVRWQRNNEYRRLGLALHVFESDYWRLDVSLWSWTLVIGRSFFYTKRKEQVRDAS